MTTTQVALVLLCLMTGTAMAQPPTVTPLMSKDLAENPGREVLMITVEYARGGSPRLEQMPDPLRLDEAGHSNYPQPSPNAR